MTRALFGKQMMEVFSWLYEDKKTRKRRSSKAIIVYAFLYLVLFGFLGCVFGFWAYSICKPLSEANMEWLYWCLMGIIAVFMGVFGSVFNTYSSLYLAKDNDLLLSMPIPASRILLVRLSGVYVMGLMYELLVMIPTVLIRFIIAPISLFGVINALLVPIVLSMFILVLSVVLGWVVAVITTKIKHKNIITVAISLIFIAVYYYVYAKAYSMLQNIVANAEQIGQKLRTVFYPMYHMGLAAEGNMLSMLIFTVIIGLLLLATWLIVSKSFLKLATANKGTSKSIYKERSLKSSSVGGALLRKELQRFTGSANYMLNCGLGIILMPISAVLLVWKADMIRPLFSVFSEDELSLLAICAVCCMISMNYMTAPSISLEGKTLWLIQSFPISGRQILLSKLKMHVLLTLIPAVAPIIAVEAVIRPKPFYALALPVATVLFMLLIATVGLVCNLKMPNLNWSNEVVPIKQSAPVTITLFGGWAVLASFAGSYILLQGYVNPVIFLVCALIILALADGILLYWLLKKGAGIFERLQ